MGANVDFVADILLIGGAVAAAFYCFVLSRRLRRFNDLDKGVGGAVAVLSGQVDDMTKTLKSAQSAAGKSTESLQELTSRAEDVARRLELMLASMHDLPVSQDVAETPANVPNDSIEAEPDATEDSDIEEPVFTSRANSEKDVALFRSTRKESSDIAA